MAPSTRGVLGAITISLLCLASCWSSPQGKRPSRIPVQVPPPDPHVIHDLRSLMLEDRMPHIELDVLAGQGLGGTTSAMADLSAGKPLLLVVRSAHCDVSDRNGPELAQLERDFHDQVGFAFLALDEEGAKDFLLQDRERHGFRGPGLHDSRQTFARTYELRSGAEVLLFDRARTLKYRGAVDDQHQSGHSQAAPKQRFLRDAISALLKDERPEVQATSVAGMALDYQKPEGIEPAALTYHDRVARIVANNCVGCHRVGGSAPFALDDYEALRKRSSMISWVLQQGVMPPWFAAPAEDRSAPRTWANRHQIAEGDKQDLLSWLESTMEPGDPALAPVPESFPSDWQIGTPDLIARIPEAVQVPAEGFVEYSYHFIKLDTDRDHWIDKIQIRPSVAQNVHHVVVLLEKPTSSRITARDRILGFQRRNYFAAMTPNQETTDFPLGTAKLLPAGAWLKFQIHYVTNGISVQDQTEIGFRFSSEPPLHELQTLSASNAIFKIPPRASDPKIRAQYRFRENSILYSFSPHMHLRGKSFTYELSYPGGHTERILEVSNYDFNWQLRYRLARPLQVPAGSILRATAHFDNSSDNPANPDPSQYVRFGPRSSDEMMIGYFELAKSRSRLR